MRDRGECPTGQVEMMGVEGEAEIRIRMVTGGQRVIVLIVIEKEEEGSGAVEGEGAAVAAIVVVVRMERSRGAGEEGEREGDTEDMMLCGEVAQRVAQKAVMMKATHPIQLDV